MNVFILTEGGKKYGFGHVARCSSIYQAFLKRDIAPKFIINGDESVESILNEVNFEIHDKEKIAVVGRNGCNKIAQILKFFSVLSVFFP